MALDICISPPVGDAVADVLEVVNVDLELSDDSELAEGGVVVAAWVELVEVELLTVEVKVTTTGHVARSAFPQTTFTEPQIPLPLTSQSPSVKYASIDPLSLLFDNQTIDSGSDLMKSSVPTNWLLSIYLSLDNVTIQLLLTAITIQGGFLKAYSFQHPM
jgi:hypothetical protein